MLMRFRWAAPLILIALTASACGGVLKKEYEYEEELYPALDGSATVYVNASIPALVALRGASLDADPRARFDRGAVRALFSAPGVRVRTPTSSRKHGRRFVHVRIDADDIGALARVAPLAWSQYRLRRDGDLVEFRQTVGGPADTAVLSGTGWTGAELVAFRLHLPSRIEFHNARELERGNITTWEQPLAERLKGVPVEIQVRMEASSILARTLTLFGTTILAAAAAFALVIWWIARRGRAVEMAGSQM
jgi:hypothetical protein